MFYLRFVEPSALTSAHWCTHPPKASLYPLFILWSVPRAATIPRARPKKQQAPIAK